MINLVKILINERELINVSYRTKNYGPGLQCHLDFQ
jgi:hypothetical protein